MSQHGSEDSRSTAEIIAATLKLTQNPEAQSGCGWRDDYWNYVGSLHKRGGQTEFEAAKNLLTSSNAVERELGSDILGQLGWGRPTPFYEYSVTLLINALADPAENVVTSAAYSLGHRRSPRAIEPLLSLLHHGSDEVRRGVVHGLSGQDVREATNGLIELCSDRDSYVRDWASFGLAELVDIDYPERRATLVALLTDENPEIRGQALIGLAKRRDLSCLPALRAELRGEFNGIWAVNAAAHVADP